MPSYPSGQRGLPHKESITRFSRVQISSTVRKTNRNDWFFYVINTNMEKYISLFEEFSNILDSIDKLKETEYYQFLISYGFKIDSIPYPEENRSNFDTINSFYIKGILPLCSVDYSNFLYLPSLSEKQFPEQYVAKFTIKFTGVEYRELTGYGNDTIGDVRKPSRQIPELTLEWYTQCFERVCDFFKSTMRKSDRIKFHVKSASEHNEIQIDHQLNKTIEGLW